MTYARYVCLSIQCAFLMLLVACGGSGGSGNTSSSADFTLSASPTSLSLENGQTQTLTVNVSSIHGYSSVVSITVENLPKGVTASPATFNLTPGSQQAVTLSAATDVSAGTATITMNGVSGTLSHSAQVALTLSYVAPDFSLSISPSSISVNTGASQNVTVGVTGSNGFSADVAVTASQLPTGVTATPDSFTLAPGGTEKVTLSADSAAAIGSDNFSFTGTSGNLAHSKQATITVSAAVTGSHAPVRTRILRTNSSYYYLDSWVWNPPLFSAYDAIHRQFFVSNPYLNEVDVFSADDETETAKISVTSGPWGLDVSPYDGNLYVGTMYGDIYVINTSTLTVAERYPTASIGPDGFGAIRVMPMADGLFALDTGGGAVVWDRTANTLDYGPSGSGEPNVFYPYGNGPIILSGDRKLILTASTEYCYTDCQIGSYNPDTKQVAFVNIPWPVRSLAATPNGSRFAAIVADQIALFDTATLQMLVENPGPFSGATGSVLFTTSVMSTDGTTLFVYDALSGEVHAFDSSTLAQVGWIPVSSPSMNYGGLTGAIDETGLIVGPISGGVGFIDTANLHSVEPTYLRYGIPEDLDILPDFPTPVTGSVSGGTQLNEIASGTVTDDATLNQTYIGNIPGVQAAFSSSSSGQNTATALTPPSSYKGAVDTTVTLTDGAVQICPECFTYGPSVLELPSNAATADGGGIGLLVGYGFGPSASSASGAGVSITIGGRAATVLEVQASPILEPYPFNSNELIFQIPPGTAGTAADFYIITSSGYLNIPNAFHYVPAIRTFPISDTLQQGVYDASRDRYYFAGKTQIQVLSVSSGAWLAPISLPGETSSTQLFAIAESPDGSKLAVSDNGGQAIYVLNPDNPASVTRYSMLQPDTGNYFSQWPSGLAITNSGMVYFATNPTFFPFMKLDPSTGQVTSLGRDLGGDICASCSVLQSMDGNRIYGLSGGIGAFWVDPSTDQVTYSSSYGGGIGIGPFDLAVSADSSTVDVNSSFSDAWLNFESTLAYSDWEWFYPSALNTSNPVWNTTWLHGQKLNADGSIIYMPLNNGIDLYARNSGRLLYRIQIPVTIAPVSDPLVSGRGANVLAVISASGVSIVDLSSLSDTAQATQSHARPVPALSPGDPLNPVGALAGRAQPLKPNDHISRPALKRIVGPNQSGTQPDTHRR